MNREDLNAYFEQYDLDIRKSHDARYVDQKCTPDIVCFIADCVVNMIATQPQFTVADIWNSQYFIQNVRVLFNKPWADNKNACNEYNKVLSQPLKLLAYAHVLDVEVIKRTLTFSVRESEILEYIAMKDRNAYNFLYCYFVKVMNDSNFMRHIEAYEQSCKISPNEAREELYNEYYKLIRGNTPTRSQMDIHRMFHKVLNVYAVEHQLPGSNGNPIMYFSDLMYNKINWRDINKIKTKTRKEVRLKFDIEKQEAVNKYYVQKAIALIKKIHSVSEVQDAWGNGEATQVHHIFPRATYPEISAYLENLILLTATQHNTKAHPNNNTQEINKDYQLVCLLAKSDSIEESIRLVGNKYYRKESFVYVINVGLHTTEFNAMWEFSDIKKALISMYNS